MHNTLVFSVSQARSQGGEGCDAPPKWGFCKRAGGEVQKVLFWGRKGPHFWGPASPPKNQSWLQACSQPLCPDPPTQYHTKELHQSLARRQIHRQIQGMKKHEKQILD